MILDDGLVFSRFDYVRGKGYIAGEPPAGPGEEDPDGRARILNEPSVVRIDVFDRRRMEIVRSTRSAPDGTWRVNGLDPGRSYLVIGYDDRGVVNAAVQDWVQPHVPEP